MALSASTIWECETGGSDTICSGGFNPSNGFFATDLAATSGTGTAPVVSSASYTFVAGDVGAWLFVQSGTNWNFGWYKIVSVSAGAATVNATIGAGVVYSSTKTSTNGPSTVQGVATVASPTTGKWGVDYSQQASARIAYTDLVIAVTTTNYTSAANPVGKNIIGNLLKVTSGVNFTVQTYEIVSTAGTTATCDKSMGTAAAVSGVGYLGGAFASPGMTGSLKIQSNAVFWQTGTYTVTSATPNVSNGVYSDATGGGSSNISRLEGYATVRGDKGTRPTIKCDGILTGITLVTLTSAANYRIIDNIIADGNSRSTTVGFSLDGYPLSSRLHAQNCTSYGIFSAIGAQQYWNSATGCSGTAAIVNNGGLCFGCEAWSNTTHGFYSPGNSPNSAFDHCYSTNNSGASTDGFNLTNTQNSLSFCVAVSNGRHGFNITGFNGWALNCIAESNSGYGFTDTAGIVGLVTLVRCSGYNNNTSGNIDATRISNAPEAFTAGTSSFFVNAAVGDFSLNSLVGSGALLRATGYPAVYPRGTTLSFPDVGAAQHRDAGLIGGVLISGSA